MAQSYTDLSFAAVVSEVDRSCFDVVQWNLRPQRQLAESSIDAHALPVCHVRCFEDLLADAATAEEGAKFAYVAVKDVGWLEDLDE